MNNEAEPRPVQSETNAEPPYPSPGYAWYVVGVLMIVYVLSFIDRQILSLIVDPVKKDLNVGDTAMGLLMGFSFAMFYSVLGIPFGWLSDRKSRRSIIAIGVAFWSATTALCVAAREYWHLFLLRVGVGIGEAALSPAAYSLITDYFPRNRLGTALSVYGMGIYIGSGMAFLLGGKAIQFAATTTGELALPLIGDVRPWQMVFFVVGAPGLLIAALVYTIREPIRRGLLGKPGAKQVSFVEFMQYVGANRGAILYHHFGFALLAFMGYATIGWIAAFFGRVHGWGPADIAQWYGLAIMIFGASGITYGGILSDWLSRKGYRDGKILCGIISAVLSLPLGIAMPLMPTGTLAMILVCPLAFVQAMPFGAAPAAVQEIVPSSMRGQAGAFYLLVINIISIGFAATTVGALNDFVFDGANDPTAVGKSLMTVTVATCIGAIILLSLCRAPFKASLDRIRSGVE